MSEHDTLHYCLRLADLRLVPDMLVVVICSVGGRIGL